MNHNLIVFVVFGIIAIFNMLVRKGAAKGGPRTGMPPVLPPRDYRGARPAAQPELSEEERLRKFMEALGVPTVPEPPRRIVRPEQPPAPRAVPPYIRTEIPKPVFVPNVFAPPPVPAPVPEPEVSRWEPAPPLPAAAQTFTPPPAVAAGPILSIAGSAPANPVDIQSLLKSPSSLRAAILMKEILGPPRGLQPFSGQGALL